MAEPTKKADAIDDLLTSITGRERVSTIKANVCMTCGKEVRSFRDALSAKEYTISGMCQDCQDSVFGDEDDDNAS